MGVPCYKRCAVKGEVRSQHKQVCIMTPRHRRIRLSHRFLTAVK